jgi:transforming growth factor-beta-induced protein
MRTTRKLRGALALAVGLSLGAAACSDHGDSNASSDEPAPVESPAPDVAGDTPGGTDSATICDPAALVDAVGSGPDEGTLAGTTDDPVATAASSNPVLTTLVTAVTDAGLVDTFNSADAVTVFAPTDCAFAALDPATLDAALADPTGLLTQVLAFHVVAGQRLSPDDLANTTELETFSGAMLPVESDGDTITVGGGQARVVVPDIQTANATVHLIDHVMVPPAG